MQRAQQLQPAGEHGALGVGLGLGLELWLELPSSCSRPLSTLQPALDGGFLLLTTTTYHLLLATYPVAAAGRRARCGGEPARPACRRPTARPHL
eukprot:scaffold51627_cov33-Phaeocystis_antarctica.AAC.1